MVYERIIQALQSATNDNREQTRRRFPRRVSDICVASVNDTNYPVHDWSQCGVLFEADGRAFKSGDECDVVMKFKLHDVVTEIPVRATIIRASRKQVALEFVDLSAKTEKAFAKVIEDTMAHAENAGEETA